MFRKMIQPVFLTLVLCVVCLHTAVRGQESKRVEKPLFTEENRDEWIAIYEQLIRDYQKDYKKNIDAEIQASLKRFNQLKQRMSQAPQSSDDAEKMLDEALKSMTDEVGAAIKLEMRRLQLLKQESDVPIQTWETEITLAMLEHKYKKAIHLATAALKEKPSRHYARFMRGRAYIEIKEDQKARADFSTVLDTVPTSHYSLMLKEALAPDSKGRPPGLDLQLSRIILHIRQKVKADGLENTLTPHVGFGTDPMMLRYEYIKAYAVFHRRLAIVRDFKFADFKPIDVLEYVYVHGDMHIRPIAYLSSLGPENQQLKILYLWLNTFKNVADETTEQELDARRKVAKQLSDMEPDNGFWYMYQVGCLLAHLVEFDIDLMQTKAPVFTKEELLLLKAASKRPFVDPMAAYIKVAQTHFDYDWFYGLIIYRLFSVRATKSQIRDRFEVSLRQQANQNSKAAFLEYYALAKQFYGQTGETMDFARMSSGSSQMRALIQEMMGAQIAKEDQEVRRLLFKDYVARLGFSYTGLMTEMNLIDLIPIKRYTQYLDEPARYGTSQFNEPVNTERANVLERLSRIIDYPGVTEMPEDHSIDSHAGDLLRLVVYGKKEDLKLMAKFRQSPSIVIRDAAEFSIQELSKRLKLPTNK